MSNRLSREGAEPAGIAGSRAAAPPKSKNFHDHRAPLARCGSESDPADVDPASNDSQATPPLPSDLPVASKADSEQRVRQACRILALGVARVARSRQHVQLPGDCEKAQQATP